MKTIIISDYLGRHELYRFMSRSMFDTICDAFVKGRESCDVSDSDVRDVHRRASAFRFAKIHNISESAAEKILTGL